MTRTRSPRSRCSVRVGGDRVGGYDDGVRVPLGAAAHRLRPRHGARRQQLGMRPRDRVVNRHDRLVAGRDGAVVTAQRREEARRVHHAGAGECGEPVLPGRRQLTAGEGALVQRSHAGQQRAQARVVAFGRGRDDAGDLAAARRGLDERAGEVFGVAGERPPAREQDVVDDHPQRGHPGLSAPSAIAARRASRQGRGSGSPAAGRTARFAPALDPASTSRATIRVGMNASKARRRGRSARDPGGRNPSPETRESRGGSVF